MGGKLNLHHSQGVGVYQAVQCLIERDQGGVLQPEKDDNNTGDPVIKVLLGEHPMENIPNS